MDSTAMVLGCLIPLLIAAYTDIRRRMVYDKTTFPMMLAGLVNAVYTQNMSDALLGFIFAGGLLLVGAALGGAGGGDVKLAAGIGLWFGFKSASYVLLAACLFGLAWGVVELARSGVLKSRTRTFISGLFLGACGVKGALSLPGTGGGPGTAVPFGTCMGLAAWVISIWRWVV